MKYNYDGITRDSLLLLSENKFRDSRDFYLENKEKIKSGIIVPLRQIAEIAGTQLLSLDEHINTVPTKMVSRVYRDTRFSKNKRLYRDNMWIMFMRDKHEWPQYPCMWFEFYPGSYSMGVGLFAETPAFMEYFRAAVRENPDEFLRAARSAENAGAVVSGEPYKKPREGCPEGAQDYYNRRSLYFIRTCTDIEHLADERVLDELLESQKAFSPMYRFLLGVSDKALSDSRAV